MADYSRLPGPNADLWDWQLRGLCRGKDSSLFFHPEGERGAARAARELSAKEICLNCPVQKQCCEHALRVREPYGVWGGLTEEERENHDQRQKALARARAARERAAIAESAKLKEQLLRDHEREVAKAEAERREAAVRAAAAAPVVAAAASAAAQPAEPARGDVAPKNAANGSATRRGTAKPVTSAPAKSTPTAAKSTRPKKRVAGPKTVKQNPANVGAAAKKRTPAKV
jgi:WhiB family redox-sensing transcriptional regulator